MIVNVCLFFLVNTFICTINAIPHHRFRRQSNLNKKIGLPYEGWSGGSSNPSGGSPGAYYGTGVNPNYGGFKPNTNDAEGGVSAISYNHQYTHNGGSLSNWNLQQQQQQYSLNNNNNNNNPWQRPNMNNYYDQSYNRYPPGSQGWYATGGNYWQNKGQSLMSHSWPLIIGILICAMQNTD